MIFCKLTGVIIASVTDCFTTAPRNTHASKHFIFMQSPLAVVKLAKYATTAIDKYLVIAYAAKLMTNLDFVAPTQNSLLELGNYPTHKLTASYKGACDILARFAKADAEQMARIITAQPVTKVAPRTHVFDLLQQLDEALDKAFFAMESKTSLYMDRLSGRELLKVLKTSSTPEAYMPDTFQLLETSQLITDQYGSKVWSTETLEDFITTPLQPCTTKQDNANLIAHVNHMVSTLVDLGSWKSKEAPQFYALLRKVESIQAMAVPLLHQSNELLNRPYELLRAKRQNVAFQVLQVAAAQPVITTVTKVVKPKAQRVTKKAVKARSLLAMFAKNSPSTKPATKLETTNNANSLLDFTMSEAASDIDALDSQLDSVEAVEVTDLELMDFSL